MSLWRSATARTLKSWRISRGVLTSGAELVLIFEVGEDIFTAGRLGGTEKGVPCASTARVCPLLVPKSTNCCAYNRDPVT